MKAFKKFADYQNAVWEGGHKMVPNPNPKTRAASPEVSYVVALKTASFRRQALLDFKAALFDETKEYEKEYERERQEKEDRENSVDFYDYQREVWDSGKKKVPNPNPKTKDRTPEVSFSTALKDRQFRKKILKEYESWHAKKTGG